MLAPTKILALVALGALPLATPAILTHTTILPHGVGPVIGARAREAESRAFAASVSTRLLCSVDARGVARCTNLELLLELGAGGSVIVGELRRAYGADLGGLDRDASTLLDCGGGHYATSDVDVGAALASFPSTLPADERMRATSAIAAFIAGDGRNAPLFLPGSSAVPDFQAACGGGGSAPGDRGGDRGEIEASKTHMNDSIIRACSGGHDEYSLLAWAWETVGKVVEGIGKAASVVKDLFDVWHEVAPASRTHESTATYMEMPTRLDDDGEHTGTTLTLVEEDTDEGKLAYSKEADTVKDDYGRKVTTIRENCTVGERACTDTEKTEAKARGDEAEKKAKDDAGKEEITGVARCDSDSGRCVNSCDTMRSWWSAFSGRCDMSGWQEYACRRFLNEQSGCLDENLIYPTPDGGFDCLAPASADPSIIEAQCERRSLVMYCSSSDGAEGCGCRVSLPPTPSASFPRCGPESLCTDDGSPGLDGPNPPPSTP